MEGVKERMAFGCAANRNYSTASWVPGPSLLAPGVIQCTMKREPREASFSNPVGRTAQVLRGYLQSEAFVFCARFGRAKRR